MKVDLLAVLRSSEFWTAVAGATIQSVGAPVPVEFQNIGWAYVVLRVLSKVVKFVIPNPANPQGGWMKAD